MINKIIHVTCLCSYKSMGGTEVYIDALCKTFCERFHIQNEIIYVSGKIFNELVYNGISLHILPEYGNDQVTTTEYFTNTVKTILVNSKPDLLVFHTTNIGECIISEIAYERRIPYVYMFHAHLGICYQASLMFCGMKRCHRFFSPFYCSVCISSGFKKFGFLSGIKITVMGQMNYLLGRINKTFFNDIKKSLPQKKQLLFHASSNIVFCERDKFILEDAGIESKKITIISHGLEPFSIEKCKSAASMSRTGCLKLGYVGRVVDSKGVHLLIDAALSLPKDCDFELHIYGCHPLTRYISDLKERSLHDSRLHFHGIIPAKEVFDYYGKLDVVCIPSLIYETGPLTLLEGAYSGCYVAGSALIGNMSFLTSYGTVISNNTVKEWQDFFIDCIRNLGKIRYNNIRRCGCLPYRSMDDFVDEFMNEIQC